MRKIDRRWRGLGLGLLGWLVGVGLGCVSSGDGGGEGGGDDVERCEEACDRLKFFQCNDATDQALCYDDCARASADAIELFEACVENDTCDPACIADLHGGVAEGGADDAAEAGEAGASAEEGVSVGEEGGGPDETDPVEACQDACDDLTFFQCITAAEQSECRALCPEAEADARDTFTACVDASAAGCTQECWDVFAG